MAFIKGEERILYIKVGEDYLPVGCLTSNPISEEADVMSTRTRETNGWETSIPTTQRFSIDFEGLQILTFGEAGDNTKLSYDTLKIIKRNRERISWKIQDSALRFIDTGFGYITSISEANQVGEFLSFSGTIIGYGTPTSSSEAGIYLFEDGEIYTFEDTQGYLFEN